MAESRRICNALPGLTAHLGLPERSQGAGARAVTAALAGFNPGQGECCCLAPGAGEWAARIRPRSAGGDAPGHAQPTGTATGVAFAAGGEGPARGEGA